MLLGRFYSVDGKTVRVVEGYRLYEVWRDDTFIGTVHRIKSRHYEVCAQRFDKLYTAVSYVTREWRKENDVE